uniref:NYN domain-containing protein n=1 Tax=Noccaea caerulescens TaxID=107243 RepID=A0A1J3FM47_NOCCA
MEDISAGEDGKMEDISAGEDGKIEDISDVVEDRTIKDISDVEDGKKEDSSDGEEDFSAVMKRCHSGVFWDAVGFPFPRGMSPDAIHERIELYLHEGDEDITGQTYIWVYVDETDKEGPWVGSYLTDKTWESRIYFLPGGADKFKRRCRMLHDFHLWTTDFPPPSLLFLVSDQVKNDSLFCDRLSLYARSGYRVFLAAPFKKYSPDTEARWPRSLFRRLFSFEDQEYC